VRFLNVPLTNPSLMGGVEWHRAAHIRAMQTVTGRKIVLGLGNTLNRDEGLGVHALLALANRLQLPKDVEVVDGGTLGLNLLPLVEEASHLLLLDAVDAGQPPGTVVELRQDQIPLYTGLKLSQHQATFQEVLGLANFRDRLPEYLHLVGAQPVDLSLGTELSPEITAVVPAIIERAVAVLARWGLL
jgi:hydrogenase maturation protease